MRGESSVARIIRAFTFELLDRLGNVIARLAEIPDIDISVRDSIGLQFVPPEMEFDQFPAEDDSLGMFMTPAPDDTAGAPQRSMWLGGPVIIDSGTNERRPFVYLSARADQTHPDRGHTQAQMFASQVGPEATVTLGNTDLGGGDNSAFGFLSVANVLAEIARVAVQSTPSGAGRDVFCRLSAGDRVFARVRDDPDGNREILLSLDAAEDFDVVLGENNFRATYGAGRFIGVSGLSAHLVHDAGQLKVTPTDLIGQRNGGAEEPIATAIRALVPTVAGITQVTTRVYRYTGEAGFTRAFVSLVGRVTNNTGAAITPPFTIGTVPAEFRPPTLHEYLSSVNGQTNTLVGMRVTATGDIVLQSTQAANWPDTTRINLATTWETNI